MRENEYIPPFHLDFRRWLQNLIAAEQGLYSLPLSLTVFDHGRNHKSVIHHKSDVARKYLIDPVDVLWPQYTDPFFLQDGPE